MSTFVKFKKPSKTAVVLLSSLKNRAKLLSSYLSVSPSRVLRAPGTSPYHLVPKHLRATWPRPEQSHLLPEACSPNGTDKRRQRQRQTERPPPEPSNILKRFCALYDDEIRCYKKKVSKSCFLFNRLLPYVPILGTSDFSYCRPTCRITCQAACHGKTEHGIFVKFKKPSKTAVVLLVESLAKPLVMAKLNMAYLSSLKNRAKLLSSYLSNHLPSLTCKPAVSKRLNKKSKFLYGPESPNFCARRSVMMILNLSESLAKPLVMAKLNMAYLCHHLGYSVPPALHRTIWCRSTFGPRGPGLSNPTSFLRPALPMAPTRDDNARDKRSVLRLNPATFLRDFALYMTMKYAVIRKRCLNHAFCLTVYCRTFPFWEHPISAKITKTRRQ